MDWLLKKPKVDNTHVENLNEANILKLQRNIITEWKNKWETLFLRHGPVGMSAVGALSGLYINNYYRTKLKLGNYGRLSSYLPIVFLPAISSSMIHNVMIQSEIMLHKQPCGMCTQMRAGLIQASVAVLYPVVLAPLASFMFASRHYTYRMPFITENPREVFQLWLKMTKPVMTRLSVLFFVNYALGMFVTYREIIDFHRIMIKVEKRIDMLENR